MTWRKYPDLRAWIVGRIRFRPMSGQGLHPERLAKPPGYLLGTSVDVDDALRELRDEGVLFAMNRRWHIRDHKRAKKIGAPVKPKRKAKKS